MSNYRWSPLLRQEWSAPVSATKARRAVVQHMAALRTRDITGKKPYSVEEVAAGPDWRPSRIAGARLRDPDQAIARPGIGLILASLRRFWAAAARWNSSFAPLGPRRRKRSSFRMRLRCRTPGCAARCPALRPARQGSARSHRPHRPNGRTPDEGACAAGLGYFFPNVCLR